MGTAQLIWLRYDRVTQGNAVLAQNPQRHPVVLDAHSALWLDTKTPAARGRPTASSLPLIAGEGD